MLILSLVLSTACTHKRDSLLGENELSSGSSESSADVSVAAETPSEATSESTESAPPASDLSSFSSGSSDSSGTPSEDLSSSSTPADTTAGLTASESNDLSALSGDIAAAPATTQPELVIPPVADATVTTPTESLGETTMPESANVLPDATVASNPDTLPAPAPEVAATEAPKAEVKAAAVTVKAVTIPTQAINKGGASLNRYYFARKGDTAESLSQLFYGSADHTKEIAKWNGKSLKAGSLVFFVSADQPDDNEMSSFYEEQGISTDTYTVKAGDQLSTIAQEKYGNVLSWKEIASLNHLQNPDQINPGQTLTLLPTQMTSIHAKPAAVTAQLPPVKSAEPEVKVLTEEDQEEMAFAPVDKEEVAGQKLPAPGTQMEKNKETHMAALEVANPEASNFTALALAGGFAALALFLFLVRRARSRARAEFME